MQQNSWLYKDCMACVECAYAILALIAFGTFDGFQLLKPFQVVAREGKPILIIEEGDTETAAWAQHSLEVLDSASVLILILLLILTLILTLMLSLEVHLVAQVPRTVDALQGVLTVIPLQLLSYHLAVLRSASPSHMSSCHHRLSCHVMIHLTPDTLQGV